MEKLEEVSNFSPPYFIEDWTFRSSYNSNHIHGIHPYPAKMVSDLASKLITKFSKENNTVLDPFCGSGTTLVEARISDRASYGMDINPLAVMITEVKISSLNLDNLEKYKELLFSNLSKKMEEIEVPNFFNIQHWFKPKVIRDLSFIKSEIERLPFPKDEKDNLLNFFYLCFSFTIRKVSNTRKNEHKLYRLSDSDLENHNPDSIEVFKWVLNKNIERISGFYDIYGLKNCEASVIRQDCRDIQFDDEEIDLLVTSPPYGDAHSTVAYGQFSRLSLQWLGYTRDRLIEIRHNNIGDPSNNLDFDFESPKLENIVNEIKKVEKKNNYGNNRVRNVVSFFNDFYQCLEEMSRVLKCDSKACFVTGNRTIRGVSVPTAKIIQEMCEKNDLGFKKYKIFNREIPRKTIPNKNLNKEFKSGKGSTINKENILILSTT